METPVPTSNESLSFRQRLKEIRGITTPDTPPDYSQLKVSERLGKVLTRHDYQNGAELFSANNLADMSIQYLMNEYLKRQELREQKKELRFYPSSIGRCSRSITYQLLKYRATPKKGTNLFVLENGTGFHDRMEKLFDKMGILVAPELSIRDEALCISGRTDAVVWNFLDDFSNVNEVTETGEEKDRIRLANTKNEIIYIGPKQRVLLVEFKSIKDSSFHSLAKSKPKIEHEKQLQLYFYLTGIEKGIIYYENKNSQEVKEYIVEKNDRLIEEVLTEIRTIINLAKQHELAKREFTPNDIHCRYCDYRELCYPNEAPFKFEDLFIVDDEDD